MIVALFQHAARNGRWLLIAGLVLGILSQDISLMIKPYVGEFIIAVLFVAAMRIGPRQAIGALSELPRTISYFLVLNLALPLSVALLFWALSWTCPLATSLVILATAAPLSGAANLALMMGLNPAPCLRHLVITTAALPLTVIPVFALTPALGDPETIWTASSRLLFWIVLCAGVAFTLRATVFKSLSTNATSILDGSAAILMAVVVVGLMTDVGRVALNDPLKLMLWLAVALAANFTLQITTALILRYKFNDQNAASIGIVAGNRNVGLFLAALPATVADPLFLFIGCYQIPMYLTPVLFRRFYQRLQFSPPEP